MCVNELNDWKCKKAYYSQYCCVYNSLQKNKCKKTKMSAYNIIIKSVTPKQNVCKRSHYL